MEIEAVKSRKPDIQNDAPGRVRALEVQKLFWCAKSLHIELNGADEAFQRFPDGSVIVDDKHHRLTHHLPLYDRSRQPPALIGLPTVSWDTPACSRIRFRCCR